MEVISTIFDQLQEDIHQRLRVLEKQVVFMLAQNQRPSGSPEALDFLENKVSSLSDKFSLIESRLRSIEAQRMAVNPATSQKSGGLEGLVIQPSPALTAVSVSNSVVLPMIQRTLVLQEDAEEEPDVDEDAEKEMVAERTGGLTAAEEEEAEEEAEVDEEAQEEMDAEESGGVDEEEAEEQEVEEEEVEEEEEEQVEELELEEFTWKGKAYYKDQHNNVYRADAEGNIEDDPFATYDPTNNKLTRIS